MGFRYDDFTRRTIIFEKVNKTVKSRVIVLVLICFVEKVHDCITSGKNAADSLLQNLKT